MLEQADWSNSIVGYDAFFKNGNSPSQLEGMSWEEESKYRYLGSHLIQRAGRLLKMYETKRSIEPDAAMACTLIAGKVEECCRRIRDVEYYKWRDRTTSAEMCVLRELGFHVQPRHSIGLLANYLNALELSDDPRLGQRAINYTNDGLRSVAYVCWQPPVIACAAIRLAARDLQTDLPERWLQAFDVEEDEVKICEGVLESIYMFKLEFDIALTADDHAKGGGRIESGKDDRPRGSSWCKSPDPNQGKAQETSRLDDRYQTERRDYSQSYGRRDRYRSYQSDSRENSRERYQDRHYKQRHSRSRSRSQSRYK